MQNDYLDIKLYEGSPFIGDNKSDYRFRKINEIQDDAKEEKLIIIENLNQIHPFLFDLYNMNYIVKDEKKFARICFDNFNEQLTEVCDNFRIIILENRYFINKCDLALLSRLETMILMSEVELPIKAIRGYNWKDRFIKNFCFRFHLVKVCTISNYNAQQFKKYYHRDCAATIVNGRKASVPSKMFEARKKEVEGYKKTNNTLRNT